MSKDPVRRLSPWLFTTALLALLASQPLELSASAGAGLPAAMQAVESVTLELWKLADQLHGSPPATRRAVSEKILQAIDARNDSLVDLLRQQPEAVLQVALSSHLRKSLPVELRAHLEQVRTLEGKYSALIADDLDQETATLSHYLQVKGLGRVQLHLVGPERELQTGATLRVRGTLVKDHMVASTGSLKTVSASTAGTAALATPITRNVAIILFNFRNNTAQPWSLDSARSIAFNSASSAKAYFNEASFGQLIMTGDVFGWYTIPYDNVSCGTFYETWSAAARSAAQATGVNLSQYTNFVYAFPSTSGCPGTGWADVGGPEVWLQGSFYNRVVAHELGHNFGARHASSYSCTDPTGLRVPLSGTCSRSEYGDPFDVMGGSMNHFNNFHKGQVGWLGAGNTQTVTGDGLYTILPIEQATGGVQSLRVRRDASNYFYLEFRQPFGIFDNFSATSPVVNGVSIRLAPDYSTLTQSLLLDATPATFSFGDAALPAGSWFDDPLSGVSISTLILGPAEAMVSVTFGQGVCTRAVPGITISPASQWGAPGATLAYNITLYNNDSSACPVASFEVTPTLPAGWSQSPASLVEGLPPGQSLTRSVAITSAAGAPEGLHTFTQAITNSAATAYSASASANFNIQPPDTTPPTVTILSPLDGSALTKAAPVKISASAIDASGIGRIEILVDNALLASCDSVTTCRTRWSQNGVAAGAHTITVSAQDKAAPIPNRTTASVTVIKM